MKRIVSVILVLTLVLCLMAAASAEGDVKIKSVSPADKKVVLAPGTTWQAEVNIKPEDATNKTLEWTSSDEKIATVDENGVITGVKKGNCKITATTTDGSKKKAAITVSVKNYDLVITKPGITQTDFETTDDYNEYEVGFMGHVKRTVVRRTVTFKGGVVESAGDHAVRPVKAGEGTVESVSKENKKTTGKEKHSVYVAQSAIGEDPLAKIVNIAQGKNVKASETLPDYPARNATDGDPRTYWESKGYPATLTIDLGGEHEIDSVAIRQVPDLIWGKRTQKIEVSVSDDGEKFTKVADGKEYEYDAVTGNIVLIEFEKVKAKFVKLRFTRGTWENAQASEVIVGGVTE